MRRGIIIFGIAFLVLGGFAGCGPSEEELAAQAEQERQQKLTALQERQQELQEKRAELEEIQTRLEEGVEPAPDEGEGGEEGEEGAEPLGEEELQARAEQLQKEIDTESQEFYTAVVEFINEEPPVQGEPLTEVQKTAIRMKSDEDILVAQEYIEKGGDYRRAIGIYRDALMVDPDNERLQELKEEAEAMRFMTEERFSQAKKGMTEDEVREVLGQPNLYNIKEYEDKNVTAWYYPTNEQGAAAAVFFRPRQGTLKVYNTDFDAVPPRGEGG